MSDVVPKGICVGTFDGVHTGHRQVLGTLVKESRSRGLAPVAVTFDRHPLEIIRPERAPKLLTTCERKLQLLHESGVETLLLQFTPELRRLTAYEWLNLMQRKYGARLVVLGYDTTFGCDGLDMSIADYASLAEGLGMDVAVAPEIPGVSSSAIRTAVREGNIRRAAEMLGRPPELEGRVVHGRKVGRTLGFPTANLEPTAHLQVPAGGVYAASAVLPDGSRFPAMVNVGTRPTFAGDGSRNGGISRGDNSFRGGDARSLAIEAYLDDFTGDLYGQLLHLDFLSRLREEKRFSSPAELAAQLELDLSQIRSVQGVQNTAPQPN